MVRIKLKISFINEGLKISSELCATWHHLLHEHFLKLSRKIGTKRKTKITNQLSSIKKKKSGSNSNNNNPSGKILIFSSLKLRVEENMVVVSALRGGRLPLFHHRRRHPQMGTNISSSSSMANWGSLRLRKQLNSRSNSKGFTLFARYSQAQDIFSSSRFQGTSFL